jgi:hypothetical protein
LEVTRDLFSDEGVSNLLVSFFLEWVTGSPNIDASNFTYLWLYLTIPNGAWVVIPFYLLWESFQAFFDALGSKKRKTAPKSPKSPNAPPAPVTASAPASPDVASPSKASLKRKPVLSPAKSPKGRAKKATN